MMTMMSINRNDNIANDAAAASVAASASATSPLPSGEQWLVRGLPNKAGTACHVASPIVILFYAVPPIRQVLSHIESVLESVPTSTKSPRKVQLGNTLSKSKSRNPLLLELARVFRQLARANAIEEIDPFPLYKSFNEELGIKAYDLGDAVTALSKLVHNLRFEDGSPPTWNGSLCESNNNNNNNKGSYDGVISVASRIVSTVIQFALGTGTVSTVIRGAPTAGISSSSCQRIKNMKPKRLPNPMTLRVHPQDKTLLDCLHRYSSPVVVEGYEWVEGTYEWMSTDNNATTTNAVQEGDKDRDTSSNDHCPLLGEDIGNKRNDLTTPQEQSLLSEPELEQGQSIQEESESTSSSSFWTTTKENRIDETPFWWLLHLDALGLPNKGPHGTSPQTIGIPGQLDYTTTTFTTSQDNKKACLLSHTYTLTGAILHKRPTCIDEEEEEGNGHYVALIRYNNDQPLQRQRVYANDNTNNNTPDQWFLIDDDKVTQVPEDEAMNLLVGRSQTGTATVKVQPQEEDRNEETAIMCAVLLVYQREDALDTIHPILEQSGHELRELIHQIPPPDAGVAISESGFPVVDECDRGVALVGRRLRVKWSKGRYYAGTITEYDDSSGMHTVLYDDGDRRQYMLSKKSIEWEGMTTC